MNRLGSSGCEETVASRQDAFSQTVGEVHGCHCSGENILSEISDLKSVIEKLCDRVFRLEKTLQEREEILAAASCLKEGTVRPESISVEIQTDQLTYAQVTELNKPGSGGTASVEVSHKTTNNNGHNNKQTTQKDTVTSDKKILAKQVNACNTEAKRKNDVKQISVCDVNPEKVIPNGKLRKKEIEVDKSDHQDLPKVMILHDSVLNGVHGKRLGRSYGFQANPKKTYKLEDLPQTVQSQNKSEIDCIAIHCGINNLKNSDAKSSAENFIEFVKDISSKNTGVEIVISKVAPTGNQELEVKRNLFNALTAAELIGIKNVSFVSHENLPSYQLRDSVHPTYRGSSVLAVNLGRHIRSLFWKMPKKPARSSHHRNGNFHPQHPEVIHRLTWWNRYSVLNEWKKKKSHSCEDEQQLFYWIFDIRNWYYPSVNRFATLNLESNI